MRLSEGIGRLRKQCRQCGGTGVYVNQAACAEPLACHAYACSDLARIHARVIELEAALDSVAPGAVEALPGNQTVKQAPSE